MADDFDPYYTWLGIPLEDQPATHYRLLGVRPFEPNLDVISNAADQRMAFLRMFQVGKRSALSQRLLNEMAAAKGCLLDPDRRKAYDEKLKPSQPRPVAAAAKVAQQPAQVAPVYSPPSPVLVPSRLAPVARPLPMAARLPSTTPDPFAVPDPFADVAREMNSQPTLPAKPPGAEGNGDFSDQVTALVRSAVARMQESPLATAAYGMLTLGVVMLLGVGLWVAFGRGQPTAVAGVPSSPTAKSPTVPKLPENQASTLTPPESPKRDEREASKPVPKIASPATITSEVAKKPATENPPAPSVETVPERPSEPPPATLPIESPASAPEPASARATTVYKVLPGKFPQPRVARFSPAAGRVAEFVPGEKVVRVWPTSPANIDGANSLVMRSNVRCVRLSANERLLAVGTDDAIEICDMPASKTLRIGLPGPGTSVVFCNDDKYVAVSSEGTKTVRLIEAKGGAVLHTFQSTVEEIRSLAAGEQWLAALGSTGQVALYDVRQCTHHGNLVPRPELPLTAVHMRDKHIFAFDSRCMSGWSAQDLKQLSEWSNTRTTPVFDAFDVHTLHFTQQANGILNLFQTMNHESPLARIAAPGAGKFDVVDIAANRMLTIGDGKFVIWNLDRVKEAKETINPDQAIATWSGAKPAAALASAEKPTVPPPTPPKPSPASPDGLETVDPATALEALRGLGVQQLPSSPAGMGYLNLFSSRVTDDDAKYVAAFPELKNLYADRIPFSGKSLRYLARLKELTALSMSSSRITDDDLKLLAQLHNLEVLLISDTAITAAGIEHLKDLPKLRQLDLPQNINRDVIPALAKMKQLERLTPTPARIDDADLAQLSQLKHLKYLDLQQATLTLDGYQHLLKFEDMENISLHYQCPREVLANLKNMQLTYFSFPQNARDEDVTVVNMPSLKMVEFNAEMSDKAVAAVAKLDNLERLSMNNTRFISDGGLTPLKRLKRLKEIDLPQGVGNAALRIVSEIPTIERVNIPMNCQGGDEGIEAVAGLIKLQSVSVPIGCTDRSLAALAKQKNLVQIVIYSRQMTDKGLRTLAPLEKLQRLTIHAPLTKDHVAALKTLKQVKDLSIQDSGLTEEDAVALRQALPQTQVYVGR